MGERVGIDMNGQAVVCEVDALDLRDGKKDIDPVGA
jgi:hypothetical protein